MSLCANSCLILPRELDRRSAEIQGDQQRSTFDPARGELRPWLFGILTRKLARYQRAEKARYLALARAAEPDTADSPDERITDAVSAAALRAPLAAALYQGMPRKARLARAEQALARVGLRTAFGTARTSFPAGRSNVWRSPARSPRNRCCCWPTSPPATLTARPARASWRC